MSKDYYEILGVEKGASQEEIKKAYKKLAKKYHPDLHQDEKEKERVSEKFKEISEAAAVLGNKEKREQYDRYGSAENPFEGFSSSDFSGMGFEDIFESIFGGMGFGGFGGGRTRKGSDLAYEMWITLEEAASGVTKTITIPKYDVCSDCSGSGSEDGKVETCSDCHGRGRVVRQQRTPFGVMQVQSTCRACGGKGTTIKTPCNTCRGTGRVEVNKKVKIDIPPGVSSGSQLRVSGEGEAGEQGVPPGDLFIHIGVQEHKTFKREEDDIIIKENISFSKAALGGTIKVPTLEGEKTLKIPAGTQPGTILRMKGLGITHLRGYGKGDQHVIIKVEVPTKLSKKEKELIEQLDKSKKKGWF